MAVLLAAALPAQAQSGRACMLEAPIQALGAPTVVTLCLQGRQGTSRSVIKDLCEGVAWNHAGGMGRNNGVRMTWLAQCPKQEADAVCRQAYDGQFDIWHYDRNEGQLDALAEECEADDGQWQEFE